MLRYVLRRLLVVVPTLVGVTIVSFVLLVLAPPPTAERSTTVDPTAYQRSLFAGLPLVVNPAPADLDRDVDRILRSASRGGQPAPLVDTLASRGACLIPLVVPRLESLSPRARAVAVAALEPLVAQFTATEGEAPAAPGAPSTVDDRVELWVNLYEARRLDFRPSHVRRLVRRLRGGKSLRAEHELVTLGTFTLESLIDALARTGSRVERARIARVLARIVPDASAGRLAPGGAENLAAWREWWFVHRTDYVRFGRIERALAVVLQTRYGRWVARLTTLQLGLSLRDGKPILAKLASRVPVTISLAALAAIVAFIAAVPLGVFTATRHRSTTDRLIGVGSFVLYSLPTVWVGTLLLRYLCGEPGAALFPSGGLASAGIGGASSFVRLMDASWHLTLPVLCLAYPSLVALSRHQRTAMLDVIRNDYVRTARAKGLPERVVILRHALRNALLPVMTLAGLQIPLLLSSAVLVEEIFQIPGVGLETLEAVRARDVPWLLAVTVIGATLTILSLVVTDVLYALVDPRTRRPRAGEEREA